jgi:tetratricopeptide (TPR) repeat protein
MESVVPRNRIATVATAATVIALGMWALGCGGAAKHHAQIKQQGESFRYELAELYVDKGAPGAAIPLLQKILDEDANDVRARVLYGNILRDQGLYPQAEAQLRFALDLAPERADVHAGLGILYDLQRKQREALDHHRKAVLLAPRDAAFRNNLGFSLYISGQNVEAIAELERALALDPAMGIAYNNLGFAYGREGLFNRARTTFLSALGEAQALINMAIVYDDQGMYDEADTMREQAYAIDPDLRPDPVAVANEEKSS